MAAIVFAIICVNFLLIHAAPGDPASVIAGQSGAADAQFVEQLRHEFGLDKPLGTQLWIYVSSVARGDLGISHRQQRTVVSLIAERLPATLLLTGTAFAFALVAGIALGAAAARRVGTWADSVITVLALGFYATPIFWVGLMLVLVFSVWLGWLPSFGMNTVGADLHGWAAVADTAQYLVLPALTLGLFYMAVYARLTRSAMLDVAGAGLHQDGAGQGRAGGPHPAPPRPAQRAAAGGDPGRHPGRPVDRRFRAGGDGVRLARHRPPRLRRPARPRLPGAAGRVPDHLGPGAWCSTC